MSPTFLSPLDLTLTYLVDTKHLRAPRLHFLGGTEMETSRQSNISVTFGAEPTCQAAYTVYVRVSKAHWILPNVIEPQGVSYSGNDMLSTGNFYDTSVSVLRQCYDRFHSSCTTENGP